MSESKSRSEQILECVTILAEAWRQKITPMTVRTYELGLSDLDINAVKRGVMAAIRDCQFMPSVHELRKLAGAADSRIDAKDRPLLAWLSVRSAISKAGAYSSATFDDDTVIIATIRELGGWERLCDTLSDEMHWLEKRFCATYSALCSVKLSADQTKRLPGIIEISNGREGYRSAPIPVAQIRSLTSPNVASEPITLRLEQQDVPKPTGPHIASAKLVERLTVEDREPDLPTVPPKSKEQQLADLKRLSNGRTTTADQAN
ncbi:MAG: DUF6475 domain-containing protein [Planctomycetia bacterium]|nr:DUF6475 domain-containing protein [Planctomycetia bacterium]